MPTRRPIHHGVGASRRTISRAALLIVSALLLVTACGGGGSSATSTTGLRLAFGADMQVPDPDIFYEIEGNQVVTSVYDGLVRYKPDSTEIEPAVAERYTVSPDGLTYTFTLRSGVKFHDGTALDSTAAKASFQRRIDVGSAPSYMLADLAGMATPDPLTFVVTLKRPVSAFLDYLAAPYGPKMVSPTVVAAHNQGDQAQKWLATHDAGTGPYQISTFQLGQKYELTAFDGYWGGAPQLKTISISIIPDISTQRLQLEGGQLDMILHGLTTDDINSFSSKSNFTVSQFPVLIKSLVFVNPNKGPFTDLRARQGLQGAIDRAKLTNDVYGPQRASVSNQIYPTGELPAGLANDSVYTDANLLKTAVAGLPDKRVDLGYVSDDPTNQRMANLLLPTLQAAGLQVSVRGLPFAQVFDLPNNPAQAPDLLVTGVNPDAAHPDTWGRIFNSTTGSLNWLGCKVPSVDPLLDQGLNTTDKATVQSAYGKAGDEIAKSACWDDIADVKDTVIARKGLTGITHQIATPYTVRLADLKVQ